VPRGRALGYVMNFPEEDRVSVTRLELLDRIGVALAGRAAEDIIFQDVTTGAQNDFQQATNIARRMVTRWGMSDVVGRIALSSSSDSYLGDYDLGREYSEDTAKIVDTEVKKILDEQYQNIKALLEQNLEKLESVVSVLIERETLHADEFEALMRGEKLPEDEAGPSVAKLPKNQENPKPPRFPSGMKPNLG
jgi:cell division protease FtsH